MKHLLLMRHAKSDWGNESLDDIDRPLNDRGRHDAVKMGKALKARGLVPDMIYCSTALRARQTAEGLTGEGGGFEGISVQLFPELYAASARTILNTAQSAPDSCNTLMLIGHNPGMGELAEVLTGHWLPQGMKTATAASITVDADCWLNAEKGELDQVLYARELGIVSDRSDL